MIDLRSLPKNVMDNVSDMIDQASWPKGWPAPSLDRLVTVRENPSSRRWSLLGMFAIGMATGAIAFYAVSQRSEIKRLAGRALNLGDGLTPFGEVDVAKSVSVTSSRRNHRRKAESEVL